MNIVICGFGRAAKSLIHKILSSDNNKLIMVLCRNCSNNAFKNVGEILFDKTNSIPIIPINEAEEQLKREKIDVIIDFSHRDMAFPLIELSGKIKSNLVICTTNHSIEEISKFQIMSDILQIGIVYAPNLTVGVNLLMDFVGKISKVLPTWNFEIIEKHPKDKGIPTATARMISQAIDKEKDIPIHSVRLDGYVGVHQAVVTDGIERITISHESLSRGAFANGAIMAAGFIAGKKGLFLMKDVINEIEKRACYLNENRNNCS